jgi:hypothetical protein
LSRKNLKFVQLKFIAHGKINDQPPQKRLPKSDDQKSLDPESPFSYNHRTW